MNYLTFLKSLLAITCLFPLVVLEASPKQIWKDGIDYIELSGKESLPATNHSYQLETKKLARILSQLKIVDKTSDDRINQKNETSVFTDKEINILAQGISKALNQSTNGEVVKFSVSDFRNVYLGSKRLSVSGTAFVHDHKLNIIFGEVHVDLQRKYVRDGKGVSNSRFASNVELSNFKLNTGDFLVPGEHDWQLQIFVGAARVDERYDWLSIDLNKEYDYFQKISNSQTYLSEAQKVQQQTDNELLEERIRKLEATSAPIAPVKIIESSVELRLKKLKALYIQGDIPEEIYLEKLRTIMSEL